MTPMRPLLHVLVVIVLIATGFMTSVVHAHPGGDGHGSIAIKTHTMVDGVDASTFAPGELAHGDHGADFGRACGGCCPYSSALPASDGLPMRAIRLTPPVVWPIDLGHPDALSEALPRPPRTFA